jgi:hypothetical protein
VPSFCRHGRLQLNCPICSKQALPATPARSPSRPARNRSTAPRVPKASSGVRVRRVQRAPEDGYDNELVPGLRSSADGARLADELAFSAARLAELAADPPGLYAAAAAADAEEALWLVFLIAYVGPGRGGDAWSEIERARVSWATGELPALDGVGGGPRTAHDPARGTTVVAAYRAWAARHGGQAVALRGDADWEPARRFARTFERLALPAFGRSPKYEFLVSAGALGLVALEAGTLAVGKDALDPVISAAKRVLGIGDAINLERRAAELARATGVPFAVLDLALFNLDLPEDERATMGARVAADPERRAAIGAALGV